MAGEGQVAVHDMQIGAADAAGADPYPDFAGAGLAVRQFHPLEFGVWGIQSHRMHGRGLRRIGRDCLLTPSCRHGPAL